MRDNVTKVYRPWAYLNHEGGPDNPYTVGIVYTTLGIVDVYSQPDVHGSGYTRLAFVCEGYSHQRNIDAFYSDRYLVTLASRFAREVVEKSY